MAFTAYATNADIETYVPGAIDDLWSGDNEKSTDALERVSRGINSWLKGLDRFLDSDIPLDVDDDGEYAEVLIELTVYSAVWQIVRGVMAGEAFADHWGWVPQNIREIKRAIRKGEYELSGQVESTAGSPVILLQRSSV